MGNKLSDYQKAFDAAHEDARMFGIGFMSILPDGTLEHIDAKRITIKSEEVSSEPALQKTRGESDG